MAGRKTLRSIRLAREATNGTRVTPRYLWRGNGDWVVDEREVTKVEELVGISGGTDRTYIAKLAASVEIAETEATYKQLPALFYGMGLTPRTGYNTFGTRVPAMNTGASGSIWRYGLNIPSTVFPTNYSYTVESGDNVESQVAVYAVTEEVQLTFEAGEAAKVSANMLAQYGTRTNAEGSFSEVGTLENVTVMLSSKTTAFDLTPVSNATTITAIHGVSASRYWLAMGNTIVLRDGVEHTTVYTGSQSLNDVFAINENNVWVVGNGGTILYYNGSTWTAQTSGTSEDLNGVWGSSATSVWAVGDNGTVLFFDGTSWTAQTSGTSENLNGVWGSSATSVWAVGGGGVIQFYNGSSWATQTSGTVNTLESVWGSSATSVWAVGISGTIVFSSNGGSTWTAQTSGTTAILYDVWGSSATSVWISGSQGGVILFSSDGGSNWATQSSGNSVSLLSIWGSSGTSVWAVGGSGRILFYNGATWAPLNWWTLSDNAVAGNLLNAELTFKALWSPKYWLDGGNLFPGTMVLTGHEITGKLTFEHQKSGTLGAAGSAGQIEKWRNQQPQVLNLLWQDKDSVGSEVGFGLVLPFKWDTLQGYDDINGNNIVSGEFTSKYNETFAGRGYMFFETGFDYANLVGTV